jgi:hypothetical protein
VALTHHVDRLIAGLLSLYCAIQMASCAAPLPQLPAEGELAGQLINTTVDSRIARYYLERYLAGDRVDSQLHARIRSVERQTSGAEFTRAELRDIALRFSPDFATLLFARQLLRQDDNRRLYRAFQDETKRLLAAMSAGRQMPKTEDPAYTLMFAPGWFYVTTDSGADFARQRETLSEMGYTTHLIEVDEQGSVEDNAAVIADGIKRFSRKDENIILVSVSKGGPEAAFALGHLLAPEETRRVKAWINVGGLLRGTPLADSASRWPKSWLARIYFLYKGWDLAGVESLTTKRSEWRLRQIEIPDHILVLNYVGAPLSGQVWPGRTYDNYVSMRDLGPNDGLTLLLDELALGGVTLVQLGLDHYFLDPMIDLKTAALARVVIDYVQDVPKTAISAD